MPWLRSNGVRVVTQVTVFAGLLAGAASISSAQQSGTPVPPPVPYHTPILVLAQPADAGALPADRPVIVFRFVAGEQTDPIDALSFAVVVDGVDRTARFQMNAGEAWGTLDDPAGNASGPHDVRARICSTRGACAEVHASLSVTVPDLASASVPSATTVGSVVPAVTKSTPQRKRNAILGVLDKVLQAAHILARP